MIGGKSVWKQHAMSRFSHLLQPGVRVRPQSVLSPKRTDHCPSLLRISMERLFQYLPVRCVFPNPYPRFVTLPWSAETVWLADTTTGFLPRVVICSDGSFCCDDEPDCCQQNRGIVLNGLGAIVSTDSGPTNTSSIASSSIGPTSVITTSATAAATPATSATTSASATSTSSTVSSTAPLKPSQTSDSGLSESSKIGVSVTLPLVALAAAVILSIWFYRRRSRLHRQERYRYDGSVQGAKETFLPPPQSQSFTRADRGGLYEMAEH